jgi:hypothetical protein
MRLIKNIKIDKTEIKINLGNLFYKKKNIFIFGNPINLKKKNISIRNLLLNYKKIIGYFFIIIIKKKSVILITDVASNQRVYYRIEGNLFYLFDKFETKLLNRKNFNRDIFNFYKFKNYTPGNLTFFNNIFKFEPCTIFEIKHNKLFKKNYFENFINNPNKRLLQKNIHMYLNKTLSLLRKRTLILLFSGGKDSTLIFKYLLENKINFKPVYISTSPSAYETEINLDSAKKICSDNNIELHVLFVKLKNYQNQVMTFITKHLVFDYHFSLIFYQGIKLLKKKYGKNITILTGQSLDSVLSFGPSQLTFGNFIARFMTFYPFSFVTKLFCQTLKFRFNKNFTLANTTNKFYRNFYISFFYYPVYFNLKISEIFFDSLLLSIVHIKNHISKLMYLKIHGFLQGADNMVILKSANVNGINSVFMPFASHYFIANICKYYNFRTDIFFPKYIIKILLNKFSYEIKKNNFFFKERLSILDKRLKKLVIKKLLKKYA